MTDHNEERIRQEILSRLLPEQQVRFAENLDALTKAAPSLFLGLNVAQYRAFEDAYSPLSESRLIPTFHAISFANGTGKTHMLVLDMIGWTMGPDWLNQDAFPPVAIRFYKSLTELRNKGLLSLRLVCVADDMKASGSVYQIMKEIFPYAIPTSLDNGKCYRQIDIPHPSIDGVMNYIIVKTFDQEEVKHSGSTCNRIWINEIIPRKILGETIGRTRAKKGNPDGTIMNTATMLDDADMIEEMTDDPNIRFMNTRGHVYENCVGEEVTDEMAIEVEKSHGRSLKKNPDGPGYITNGVLSKSSIDNMIATWLRTCPHQLEARKTGAFMTGGGRIFITYQPKVHDVPDEFMENLTEKYPVVQIVDPHSAKPDFSAWAMVSPQNRLYFIAEWPTVHEFGPYESLSVRPYTIAQECEIWKKMEVDMGVARRIVCRIGDPNRFKEPNPRNGQTLAYDYSLYGFNFWLDVNDNIEVGHNKVMEYLYFDRMRYDMNPNDLYAMPHLYFLNRCVNIRKAISRYGFKTRRDPEAPISENINPKYSEGATIARYLVMWHISHAFQSLRFDVAQKSDYDRIRKGRIPKRYRYGDDMAFNAKGRKVISSVSF